MLDFTIPLRAAQAALALISLGLNGYREYTLSIRSPARQCYDGLFSRKDSGRQVRPLPTLTIDLGGTRSLPPRYWSEQDNSHRVLQEDQLEYLQVIRACADDFLSTVCHWYRTKSLYGDSPSRVNFLIFTAVWTFLIAPLLFLAPRRFPRYANKWAVLGLDAVTMLFWFAGFIALAVFHHRLLLCWGHVCHVMIAAIVFGAIEW